MNKYFNMDESVFDITERFPETIRYLAEKGFTPLTNLDELLILFGEVAIVSITQKGPLL